MTPQQATEELRTASLALPQRKGRVILDLTGEVGRLTLDNPAAKNALTAAMMVQFVEAVHAIEAWDGGALIFDATPCGAFCSGGHLGDVRRVLTDERAARAMAVAMRDATDRLLACPITTVAAIDGVAMGGGAELATAADLRVATGGSRIHFVQARLGVALGWGGASRLVRHIGRRQALLMLTGADPVDAEAALALGLVDAVLDGSVVDGAMALLEPVLALPTAAARAVKAQVSAADAGDRDAETDAFLSVWGKAAHLKALEK